MKQGSPRIRAGIVAAFVVLGALGALALLTAGTAQATTPCAITVNAENLADNAIQTAINAYPGGVVCVGPGTFPEQLTIASSGTTLRGAGASQTIIEPTEPLALNTYDYDASGGGTTVPTAAIILVAGTSGDPTTGVTGVTIENLQVNGAAGQSTFTGCTDGYVGVDFQASSGTLTGATVANVELPPSLFGCQQGLGVYAYNGFFNYGESNHVPDSVTVSHSTVMTYDKNGITCDDPQESCSITSDAVTGIGPTPLIAQNGVQAGFGAWAAVKSNHVSDNGVFTGAAGCTGSAQSYYAACSSNEGAGILLYDAASGTNVANNKLVLNEYGIDYFADGLSSDGYQGPASITISQNTVDSSTAYGIAAQGAPGGADTVTIHSNTVDNENSASATTHGAPGILVDTGNFIVDQNHLEGSSTSGGSSNGGSQGVCAPTGYLYVCSSLQSIVTSAVQGVSGSSSNPTTLYLNDNSYGQDSYRLATLGVDGGTVNVEEAS